MTTRSDIEEIRSRWEDQPRDGYCNSALQESLRHIERNCDFDVCDCDSDEDDHGAKHPSYYDGTVHYLTRAPEDIHRLLAYIDQLERRDQNGSESDD